MKFHFENRWLKKEILVDLNVETDFIYLRFFKNIIVKKLKLILIMETLFEEFQKLLKYYNIFFNIIDNLQIIKCQMSNFIMIDIGDLNMILKIL